MTLDDSGAEDVSHAVRGEGYGGDGRGGGGMREGPLCPA